MINCFPIWFLFIVQTCDGILLPLSTNKTGATENTQIQTHACCVDILITQGI